MWSVVTAGSGASGVRYPVAYAIRLSVMKGTLEKLRKIFISKRRQEDDISASKFSRSLSFKKGSMRRSLRRLTRRKAVVTNHGIIYVEGDPNSPTTPTPANYAAAFAFGQRAAPPAASKGPTDGVRSGVGGQNGPRAAAGCDSVTVSGVTVAECSKVSPSASPAPARLSVGLPDFLRPHSPRLSAGGPRPAASCLASSTGNIPAGVTRPKVRRPTDSLPRIPTEADEPARAEVSTHGSCRRASHCGVHHAVEAPHTPELAGRTAKIMSACLTPKSTGSDAGSVRSDDEHDARPADEHAAAARGRASEETNAAEDKPKAVTGQATDASRVDDVSSQTTTGDTGNGAGVRRRLPTVTATRDHLRRSLRRLSERRRKSRRPDSMTDAPSGGVDFYKMFSRVPPVLAPGTSIPSTPFTFSRRNPITQWLAESEQAQQASKKTPSSTNWDALLWSELMLTPPSSEKEARKRAKRASKKATRVRRSGVRTSSEASAGSVGTAASATEFESLGKVESGVTPQALKV